ncbi:MAG: putative Mg2+ transporter-C (MgtC) family protein [Parcubacteria bacterium C7867-005]|nr:MAG: putative Mg2+ transporter-C (MgtC) family protein [Parcubacteria bacterium C7867-005]
MSNIIFLDLVIALLLGASLGIERSFAGKTAGMRTYSLVSMGSCLFILISRIVIPANGGYDFDPMRMAAGIVMGIGFLCGGVIIFKDSRISGLTTAAGLWVASGVGMAVGYGLESLAIFATLATLIVFTFFWFIEHTVLHLEKRENKN